MIQDALDRGGRPGALEPGPDGRRGTVTILRAECPLPLPPGEGGRRPGEGPRLSASQSAQPESPLQPARRSGRWEAQPPSDSRDQRSRKKLPAEAVRRPHERDADRHRGTPPGSSFTFREHETFIVGRSQDAHFRLPLKDKYFSRFHFMVEVNPPLCRLMDMASTNGTFVNGRKVTTIDLKDGDVIKGGKTVVTVSLGDDDPREVSHANQRARLRPSSSTTGPPPHMPNAPPLDEPDLGQATPDPPDRPPPSRAIGSSASWAGGHGRRLPAHRESDGTAVALKTITPAVVQSPATVARFLREASVLRQLNHPSIVAFREIGQAGGRLYFAMEYVPGTDADEPPEGAPRPVADRPAPWAWPARRWTAWPTPMPAGSSTATSSRRTSWSRQPPASTG